MTVKNKIYLSLSIIVFFSTLMVILTSDKSFEIINSSLPLVDCYLHCNNTFVIY